MSRLDKTLRFSLEGLKIGLLNGLIISGLVHFIPDKMIDKSTLLQAITKPAANSPRSVLHTTGATVAIFGAIGALTGFMKGMFGKQEKEIPEQVNQYSAPLGISQQNAMPEPLRSPDTSREKSYTQDMHPSHSHEETASRPKDVALTR